MAALLEQRLGMSLLEIAAADLCAWDLSGNGQHRNTAAMTVEQPVDQVQVPGPTTPGADRELAREMRSAPAANAAVSSCRT